ncbi:DNA polymerase lambda isoform X1 [Selaginella moellendorffii]|uniref:DNA polymerase lambda isoform X1 n=1 Tax=Selaginella moellendorffii TaxID=88036 RepID=UPI000D1C54D4|nr:DNA polymerase lambda isoform X1 [Selaginella moellendorffii]|eukprot:XP_024525739.1 DNA polymerase lambda isoform X1 [Selaginella moellendorffii]
MTTSTASDKLSFDGIVGFFVEAGVVQLRLQVWKTKLAALGGKIEDHVTKQLTHVFAVSSQHLDQSKDWKRLKRLKRLKVSFLKYDWLEDCLKAGQRLPAESYNLFQDYHGASAEESAGTGTDCTATDESATESLNSDTDAAISDTKREEWRSALVFPKEPDDSTGQNEIYAPPNLNQNITGPFGELRDIYKNGLGDNRRSYSYHKAISYLEKLPYQVTSVDQVKNAPSIGKSLQNHIQEILSTGKLSKLEHFRDDEKVKTVSLFGSVWGIGPSNALKYYEKGHRSLEDLRHDESLTRTQRLGLQYFEDINAKIPRSEANYVENLVQEIASAIQPGISVVCGGSYRRGKSLVGDMDMIVTHSDGTSHKGFLRRLVQRLKDIDFLTEDLLIGYHEELNDDAVDTYFGLCKYPGREQRHRIDFKVYSWEQYPFGLIAWTGNDVLNRRLRILANEKGYKLDDTGLYRTILYEKHKRHKVDSKGARVICKNEKEVFEFVGHPWLEPNERNL